MRNSFRTPWTALALVVAAATAAAASAPFSLSEPEQMTAVSSRAFEGYVRARNADGTFRTETYAFGDGGDLGEYLGHLPMSDPTFDAVGFSRIAHTLAAPLARQDYVPGFDPRTTNLLIMVYWGMTSGARNTRDGYTQDVLDYANAKLLGFDSEPPFERMRNPMEDAAGFFWGPSYWEDVMRKAHAATVSELSDNRYYVILRAFDFQNAWRQKRLKLLWETRFSLTQRQHDFGRDLPAMARSASAYFGHDSYGLVRRQVPEGRVDVGEPTVVEDSVSSGDISSIAGDWQGRSTAFPQVRVHLDRGGASTVGLPAERWTAPATVTVDGGSVAIWVPGWGVSFHGKIGSKGITGTLAQYGHGAPITLYREP